MTERNEQEKQLNQAPAAPASPGASASSAAPSNSAPKRYVVNNGFDKLFFLFSIPFIVVSLSLVSLFVFFALIPEQPGSVPDFVGQLTGEQYELVVRKLGPMDDNLFRSTKAYVLVRTDADVVSNIEQKKVPDFTFVPLESPELENDKMMGQVYDSTAEIDKVYRELAKMPPGADCRYFVTRDDPDYARTYLCFSLESKLLLVVRTRKKWGLESE